MISPIIVLGLFFAVAFASRKLVKKQHKGKPLSEMPGPLSIPILGTSYVFLLEGASGCFRRIMRDCETYYPGPMKTVLGGYTNINIFKDVHLEEILSSKHITKSSSYRFLRPWLGDGLPVSTGINSGEICNYERFSPVFAQKVYQTTTIGCEKWKNRRKLFTPAFHFNILDAYSQVFFEKADILVDELKKIPDLEVFDIKPYIDNCTLDAICATAMGIEMKSQEDHFRQYRSSVYAAAELVRDRMVCPWLQPDFLWKFSSNYRKTQECVKILHTFTRNVIKTRRQEYEANQQDLTNNNSIDRKHRPQFLDLLLQATDEDQNSLSDEAIQEEVDSFMFAGHETTATILWCSLVTLGNHPEIQQKLQQELDSILEGDDRPFNKSDLTQMKYLDMVFKEALRLYSGPIGERLITEDTVMFNYFCPKNTQVILNLFRLHRDPANFPNPEKFDPERFTPEKCAKRHPYAFIPFSAGPRNCIGQKFAVMEYKIMLSTLLRNFTIVSHTKYEDFKLIGAITMKMQNPCKVSLISR